MTGLHEVQKWAVLERHEIAAYNNVKMDNDTKWDGVVLSAMCRLSGVEDSSGLFPLLVW